MVAASAGGTVAISATGTAAASLTGTVVVSAVGTMAALPAGTVVVSVAGMRPEGVVASAAGMATGVELID
jgi:hypothetical protein